MKIKQENPEKIGFRGRVRRSPNSRKTQLSEAQRTYRQKMSDMGFKPMQAYLPDALVDALDIDARSEAKSRTDKLIEILQPIYGKKHKAKK